MRRRKFVHLLDLAYHEAGHAVIAVHLHLPLARVWVSAPSQKWKNVGGATEMWVKDLRFKSFREKNDGTFERVNAEEKIKASVERHIVMSFAGKPAETAWGCRKSSPGVLASSDKMDLACIEGLRAKFGISKKRIPQLQRRAERLVQTPHIRSSIQDVAFKLLHAFKTSDGIVTDKYVRQVYQSNKIQELLKNGELTAKQFLRASRIRDEAAA